MNKKVSDRLTPEWTETLEEAFGATGVKGREGELFLIEVFKSWDWDVVDHEDDKEKQLKGIDLSFRDPKWQSFYTCDVKNNMDEYGGIYIYRDFLFNTQADRIFHVNPTTGWVAWYGVEDMREWYNQNLDRIKLYPKKSPDFIKRRKYDGK